MFCKGSLIILILLAAGCTTINEIPEQDTLFRPQGVYHKVNKGETLWRIAKAYQKDLVQITKYNNIPDAALIEENQLVFIPGVEETVAITAADQDPNEDEFIWPLKGKIIKYFGERQGVDASKGIHIQAQDGDPIQAVRRGEIIFADYLAGYAYTVIVDHLDGIFSVYGQNAEILVDVGDSVLKGQEIAKVGSKGMKSFLYFEIRKQGVADNPLFYLPR